MRECARCYSDTPANGPCTTCGAPDDTPDPLQEGDLRHH